MTIRPARDADFDAIAAITNPYIETTAIHFSYEPVTGASLAEMWRSHQKHPWLVSEDDSGYHLSVAATEPKDEASA